MIQILIDNIFQRFSEWLTKPKYDYVDEVLDKLTNGNFRKR